MKEAAAKLAAWRIACRHIDVRQAVAELARFLARHAPVEQLHVRRLDTASRAIETAASSTGPSTATGEATGKGPFSSAFSKVLQACRSGRSWHAAGGQLRTDPVARYLLADEWDIDAADVVAEPLVMDSQPVGVGVLVSAPGDKFTARHRALFRNVLEALAASLTSDHQLHELIAQRDAAEADKRSLLTRLGRDQLADVIVGQDAGLRHVMERVDLVAQSNLTVLILGETGSGKEVVARAVHMRSSHAEGPFVRVNCGAIPPELIDSELFGHDKGSFTGATESRQGWFERADGGTLLLDEIGELPMAAQVRLLRVLQDGSFERVGGRTSINVDVRIIAATHRDLPTMIGAGRFREDLWYRISSFPIRLPPLRERLDDIASLASHLATRAARRFGVPPLAPDDTDIALLRAYSWPGNVRELAAVIDRAVILGGGKRLEIAAALGPSGVSTFDGQRASPQAPSSHNALLLTLDEAMAQHIRAALRASKGRVEGPHGAAKILDINPHTLRARMRKLQIDWTHFRHDDVEASAGE